MRGLVTANPPTTDGTESAQGGTALLGMTPSNPSPTVTVAVYLAGRPWHPGGRCVRLGFSYPTCRRTS
jgi:hypothetical protein